MFTSFLSSLLYEILGFLSKHPDFFESSSREKLLEAFKIPVVFKQYLSEVSGKKFLEDLHLVLQVINAADWNRLPLKGSGFFKAVLQFFIENFSEKLDALDERFYLLPYEVREASVHKLLKSESRVASALKALLVSNSYQEIAQALEQLSKNVLEAATIMVQTPRAVPAELKKEMREHLLQEHPLSFPVFQINRQLLGGLRLFIDGKAVDYSWFSRVQKLSALTS